MESGNETQELDWDILLESIRNNECIFLLGPNMLEIQENGKKLLHPFLVDTLKKEHKQDLVAYYEQDELFLFHDDSAKTNSFLKLRTLLGTHHLVPDILQNLAAIKLHLLLSFSPYLNPAHSFKTLEIPYSFRFGYYDMRGEKKQPVDEPTVDNPLIYDLFGSIEKQESLILTYDDLFDYIKAILVTRDLDDTLRFALQRANFFIFLGFQFEKWYVQLMLRKLKSINKKRVAYAYTLPSQQIKQSTETVDILTNEFKIKIITEEEAVRSFVENLHKACKAADPSLLREHTFDVAGPYEKINQLVEKDRLEKAITLLIDQFKTLDEDLHNEAIGLKAKLKRLTKKEREDIIGKEEAETKRNILRKNLLELNQELKALL